MKSLNEIYKSEDLLTPDFCILYSHIKRKRPQHPYHDQIQINNINPKMMAVGEGFEPPRSG
tara:strand:- start:120 stop:302 length:183 start_codon:yes stop_codon:yes gene_type:complete